MEHKRAGLEFWIRSSCTDRGFATDAARTVMRLGYMELGLARIEVDVAVDDKTSCRVAEKHGCTLEDILRPRVMKSTACFWTGPRGTW